MNTEHCMQVSLLVQGPLLVKSSGAPAWGIDSAAARVEAGPDKGQLYIPGTLLKGKLVEQLARMAPIAPEALLEEFCRDWLGDASGRQSNGQDPYRGRLTFEDLVCRNPSQHRTVVRHRIQVDNLTGSAAPEMLQAIETPVAAGEEVKFTGCLRLLADEKTAQRVERVLRLGLAALTQIGSNRSIGFGRVRAANLLRKPGRTPKPWAASDIAPECLELVIRPLGPLCISRQRIGDNLFESESLIPGNVLKGAVAETWAALVGRRITRQGVASLMDQSRPSLTRHFDAIRFRHAFPVATDAGKRPRWVPLSVAKVGPAFRDLTALDGPVVLSHSSLEVPIAPAFRPDWKAADLAKVEALYGWVQPARELRVRTAIDSVRRRADRGEQKSGEAQGKLFAWEMVHPFDDNGAPLEWRSYVDLTTIPDGERQDVAAQLSDVLARLSFISKTKASCDPIVTVVRPAECKLEGTTVALVLQTPALLCDPRFQSVPGLAKHGALSAEEMLALYADSWRDAALAGDSMVLRRVFASQSLAGGAYLHGRFRQGQPYNPWLLTDPGSVFVFEVKKPDRATHSVIEWLKRGLPLPKWAVDAWGNRWDENPFLPECGFGEVALHLPDTAAPPPDAADVRSVAVAGPVQIKGVSS